MTQKNNQTEIIFSWESTRIDKFLALHFNLSRSFFEHLFDRKAILVNSNPIKKSYSLKDWDTIKIESFDRFIDWWIIKDLPWIEIPVVHETDDYLVLNKPKWVLSHPNSIWECESPSVVSFLFNKYGSLPSIWNFIRAWLLHRLDKNTDWLMLIAKTEKWLKHFRNIFNLKSTTENIQEKEKVPLKKFYVANVIPTNIWLTFIKKISDQLPWYICQDVLPKTPNPINKFWITKIIKIEDNKIFCEILTWRTHQIRIHLSSNWLPIIWDELYWTHIKEIMQLTAYRLEFEDPDWKYIILEK